MAGEVTSVSVHWSNRFFCPVCSELRSNVWKPVFTKTVFEQRAVTGIAIVVVVVAAAAAVVAIAIVFVLFPLLFDS